MRRIYLDYNATTPIAPEVREAMQPFLAEHFGNPSSDHSIGRATSEAISDAREQIANLIGVDTEELFFTGGGTESNNLAMKGVFLGDLSFLQGHLIISEIEHPATTEPAAYLEKHGVEVTRVACDAQGFVDPQAIEDAIRPDTRLVSVMLANNEVGSLQPIKEIASLCKAKGILSHTDAAQAVGKIWVDASQIGVDMLSIAGHKLYAPKGIGAIYVSNEVDLTSLLHGASHERGMRAGTENTPYIVGLGRAAKLARERILEQETDTCEELRDRLWNNLVEELGDSVVANTDLERCLPNTLSVAFRGVAGHELLASTPDICASTGAACHSGAHRISGTLQAMKTDPNLAIGTVRLSTGQYNNEADIDRAARLLSDSYGRLAAS